MAISDNDWDQRILCSDGSCIGIIGADGRCKACGMPYDGELPSTVADAPAADEDVAGSAADRQTAADEAQASDDPAVGADASDADTSDADTSDADASDDSWKNRTLCVDESCIGVIGPDGRCKECGKPYPG